MAIDSPVAVRFVAAPDNWSRGTAPIRAVIVHMAEGGGTVSWLTRDDGNSSHYVVEYDGEVVQMVAEARAAGSMNPNATRTTDDAAFSFLGQTVRYGATALRSMLGSYASNPNAASIAIEVEGFAATGPNTVQRKSLARLIADIRRRRGALPVGGHRDQQAYKACPGKRIPWIDYGGHAVKVASVPAVPAPAPEAPAVAIKGSLVPEVPTRVTLRTDPADATKSRWLYVWSDHRADPGNTQLKPNRPLLLTRFVDADTYAVAYEPAAGDTNATSLELFVHSADIAKTEPVVAPAADCTAAVKAATDPLTAQITTLTGQVAAAELAGKRTEWDRQKSGATVALLPRP
jgi:hypothetical protein